MDERIICAAIRLNGSGKIFHGHRHNHCVAAMNDELSWTMNRFQIIETGKTEGFVTSRGRFVDRVEALEIARSASQILPESMVRNKELHSENIY